MEFFAHKELFWTLKLTHEDRKLILSIAAAKGIRPTVYLRYLIRNALNKDRDKFL